MLIGVIAFSFATGALASIIASIDASEATLKEKMATLNELQVEYKLKTDLYNKLVKSLRYDHSKRSKDNQQFMNELPHKLKLELAVVIHKKMYENVKFFKELNDESFIAWIGSVIRPVNMQEEEYIFKEGEQIIEMFFLVKGAASYVLPRYKNKAYFTINPGDQFGHVDLFGRRLKDAELTVATT